MKGFFLMDIKKNKNTGFSFAIGIFASVVLAYISAVCTLPSSGIVSTFPVTAIMAIIVSFICKKRNYIYTSFTIMPFLTTLLFGFNIKRAIIVSILSIIITFFAILAKRAILTAIKSNNAATAGKCRTIFAVAVFFTLSTWLIGYGNPVSFVNSENRNSNFARERYADAVEIKTTFFDINSFSYLTEISFENASSGKHYYICDGKRDDYIDFHINETFLDAKDIFSSKTALPANCLECYINKDEFVFGGKEKLNENLMNTEYLVIREEAVPDMDGFKDLYNNLMMFAMASDDLKYKSITMTATGLDGKAYYAYKKHNADVVFSVGNKELGQSVAEKFN